MGGQPTVAFKIDLVSIARAAGYKKAFRADNKQELDDVLPEFVNSEGPVFLEIRVKKGSRPDLGRPTRTPEEGKELFMIRSGAR